MPSARYICQLQVSCRFPNLCISHELNHELDEYPQEILLKWKGGVGSEESEVKIWTVDSDIHAMGKGWFDVESGILN